MMASMGAVDESTVVVTVVHDCQVSLFHGTFSVIQHRENTLSDSPYQIKT